MLRPLCLNLSLIQQQAVRFPAQGKAELFQQSAAGSIFRHGFRLQERNALPAGKRQKPLPNFCTDAVSAAVFKTICEKAEVPYQVFLNRSDILGGSTLGNISGTQVALNTVDIGLPQLAMHSSYETAGSRDTAYLIEAAKVLFSGSFAGKGDGSYKIG